MDINILGHKYNLVEDEGMFFNTGNYGKHSYTKLEISYDPDMKPSVWKEAVLHELTEAINYWADLKLDHHQITVLSAAMFSVLRNNKELSEILIKEKEYVA